MEGARWFLAVEMPLAYGVFNAPPYLKQGFEPTYTTHITKSLEFEIDLVSHCEFVTHYFGIDLLC